MSLNNSKIHFILLAGGNSTRFSRKNNKLLVKFKNKSILEYNLSKIKEQNFHKITLVINKIKFNHNETQQSGQKSKFDDWLIFFGLTQILSLF